MGFSISNAALRLVSGAFILNSGINKLSLPAEQAAGLQQMAQRAIPQVGKLAPEKFGKYLSYSEIGIGTLLLTPFISSRLAGLALGAFSGGLVATYLKGPGMTEQDGVRPTSIGTPLAKDFWLAGIAVALIFNRKRPARSS
ncbi:hypothetical protein [Arthrobacter sp. N199823]|uniref:hypothetical protein n=1 Tax=Arthrobacter sp. N199823 TaxID=2058895 RepID=UPI000CE304BC|nr:hypothetical protein [Arthrobacter sp. N199823]